ncbi:MAG: 4-hydroxythreonine-4-phosphate dehydrogenase PdxA [Planctomycetes bacterium]|nr:4-hydroxythreonine-4-phosphate dehydrogenase PdxA [Planctomycetota bacterium]
MTSRAREVVVATGDPQGIGPEVAVRAAGQLAAEDPGTTWTLVGDAASLRALAPERAGVNVIDVPLPAPLIDAPPSVAGGRAARDVLAVATDRVAASSSRALCTGPLSKEAVALAGEQDFVGHTGWLARRLGAEHVVMLFVAPQLRVALATVHLPLSAVSEALTRDGLCRTLDVLARGLRERYDLPRPRIAVLGLNPHAGEGGLLGEEEIRVIAPAILAAQDAGVAEVSGPHSADAFFREGRLAVCDVVLAMYHDQGLLPLKALAFGEAVNVTLGLPIIRTSVDHGVAYDIAGEGRADPGSMIVAMRHARDLLPG